MRAIGCIIAILMTTWARAQPPSYYRQFTERDGLSDNRIHAITQDHQGAIWVGTANGLNRFDGYTFTQYLPQPTQPHHSISNEYINHLATSPEGKIWIATQNGLNCFDPASRRFQAWFSNGDRHKWLPSSLVQYVWVEQDDKIWLACDNRDPCLFNPTQGIFRTYPWQQFVRKVLPQTAPNAYLTVYKIQEKEPGQLWLISNVGLFSLDYQTAAFQYYPETGTPPIANHGNPTQDPLLIGTWDRDVLSIQPANGSFTHLALPLANNIAGGMRHIRDIVPYRNGHLILSQKGLFWLPNGSVQIQAVHPPETQGIPWPTAACTRGFVDRHGALWVGTEQGLWMADPKTAQFHYARISPRDAPERVENTYQYSSVKLGLQEVKLDFYGHKAIISANKASADTIELPLHAGLLYFDTNGNGWLGGGNQVFKLNAKPLGLVPEPIQHPAWKPDPKGYFVGMAKDSQGRLWLAHSHSGLLVWDPKTRQAWHPDSTHGMIGNHLSSIIHDPQRHTIWIGSFDYGLFRYSETTGWFTLLQHNPAQPENGPGAYMVTSLLLDSQGTLSMGTDPGGVSILQGDAPGQERFWHIGMAEGLPSNRVISLVMDQKGRIWAGTLGGLACLDHWRMEVHSFGVNDGLITEYLDMPLGTTSAGEVTLGGRYGVQTFFPDSLLAKTPTPRTRITAFHIFDQPLAENQWPTSKAPIELRHDQNFFSFEFTTDQAYAAPKIQYAYRLVGMDQQWNEVGNRHRGSYTNVPPGDYTLEIRARNGGPWEEPALKIPLRVKPPFWETGWFLAGVGILLLAAIWAIFRIRIRQVRRLADREHQFRQQLARTEMAALRAQMNPHFVFNCLSSINRYILLNQPEEAADFLNKFSRLIRHILDHSRNEFVPLAKELEAIQLYVELEQMRFAQKFEYHCELDPGLQLDWIEIPPMLIQPYIENAIWHGLLHQKTKGMLRLEITFHAPILKIVVEDNGIGRAKAQELKSRSANQQKSHGMAVTAERLAAMHTLFGTRSTVEAKDLFHPDGTAAGTRITLTLEIQP